MPGLAPKLWLAVAGAVPTLPGTEFSGLDGGRHEQRSRADA